MLPFLAALVLFSAAAADRNALFESECASCHGRDGASMPAGASLKGVVWRKVAAGRDFASSPALKASMGSWSPERFEGFLKDT